jgi:hypothetical protein
MDHNKPTHDKQATQNAMETPQLQPAAPVGQPTVPTANLPGENPGQTLGIVSIVLGVCMIAVVGLPMAIVSIVKSSKAHAPKTLGVIGLVVNILSIIGGIILTALIVLAVQAGIQERAREIEEMSSADSSVIQPPVLSSDVIAYGIPLTQNYVPTQDTISMTFRSVPSGWTKESKESDGMYSETLTRDDGLVIVTLQTTMLGAVADTDLLQTEANLDYLFTSMGDTVIRGEVSNVGVARQSDGKTVEFMAVPYADTTSADEVLGVAAERSFGDLDMLIEYRALTNEYRVDDWHAIIQLITIND